MLKQTVHVKSIRKITHNVIQLITNRPEGYSFLPGQSATLSIPGSEGEFVNKPFTFTSLPTDDLLEFTIKTYPERLGFTHRVMKLKERDEIVLHDSFGTLKFAGRGVFIAGGMGITPFLAIFRNLYVNHKMDGNILLFANRTKADIIHQNELISLLGQNLINILSDENRPGYFFGKIDADFLQEHITDFDQLFYLCGPSEMINDVEQSLFQLGVKCNQIIKELNTNNVNRKKGLRSIHSIGHI